VDYRGAAPSEPLLFFSRNNPEERIRYNLIMKPFLIGIGGSQSGTGKTTLACRLLERQENWGAIKYTPSPIYSSVTEDLEEMEQSGKDTALMLKAGAAGALWVRSTPEDMHETLQMAVERLSGLEGIVVEGNSAIEVLKPDIVIFIAGEPGNFKQNAKDTLKMADVVIHSDIPPEGTPQKARKFISNNNEEYLRFIEEVVNERRAEGRT
jgi:molybdopterin-guanine dinucleotide biosynthesis protein